MAIYSSGEISTVSGAKFTIDFHRCGKCSVEYNSLEDFICHKITVDKCSLVLWESKKLIGIGLKIPSFIGTDDYQTKDSDALPPDHTDKIAFGENVSNKISAKKRRGRPRKNEKTTDKNLNDCSVTNSSNWKCYPCKLTFPSFTSLDGHKDVEHKLSSSNSKSMKATWAIGKVDSKPVSSDHSSDELSDRLIIPENIPVLHAPEAESLKESTCPKCGNKYKDPIVLKTHLNTVHCDIRPFKCKFDCPLSFKTKGSLMRHIRRHTGERPYKCKECNRSFRESGALTRHLKSRFPCSTKTDNDLARYGKTVGINEYESDKASEDSVLPSSISTIKVIITDISDKPKDSLHEPDASSHIECGLIINKLVQEESIDSNEINSEQVLEKIDESPTVSSKPGDSKDSLASFASTGNELNIPSPKNGDICNSSRRECVLEVFQESPSNLLDELLVDNEDLKCFTCMQHFASKMDLKSHLMLHVGSLPFRCIQCCYVCQSKQQLVKHQRRRHGVFTDNTLFQKGNSKLMEDPVSLTLELEEEDSNIQNIVKQLFKTQNSIEAEELEFSGLIKKPAKHSSRCHICLKRFSGSLYLGCHMGIHTGEKPYTCNICKKSFFLKDSLKKHSVCHSEERKYRCGECYKSFKRLSHVRDHLRIHSLLCPYQCVKCGKAFRWQGTLKSHELGHGGPALRVHLCITCGRRFPSKWSLVRHQRLHSSGATSAAQSLVHKSDFSGAPENPSYGEGKDFDGLSNNKAVNLSGDSFMSQKQEDITVEDQVSSISDGGTETYVLITQEDGSSCLVPTVAIVEEFQEETSAVNNIEDGYT